MIDFSKVQALTIPEGPVTRILDGSGNILWEAFRARYVSFGDSIAAGHSINDSWEANYGTGSQYGNNGRTETVVVPGSYTDLIHKELVAIHGDKVRTTSFAKSGDRVDDLIRMLDDAKVRSSVACANYVTLCIGANDVLEPALSRIGDYINAGDSALQSMTEAVNANLAVLSDDNNANSYTALFNKLNAINTKAKYVFTTIYNPYKYLWLDEGRNGFFKPVLDSIPQMTILGIEVDDLIRNGLLNTSAVKTLYNRVNSVHSWAETNVTKLNNVLRSKISAYQSTNPNFMLADTKTLYESFPDRPVSAQKHYNDLVNVEYTRGYDTMTMSWGSLWPDGDVVGFWWNLAEKYVSLSGLNIEGFATELVGLTIEKVIIPDIDPHPEEYGQYALYRSFADTLGWQALDRHTISYNANGGTGSTPSRTVVSIDGLPAYINLAANAFAPATGYYFTNWNSSANGAGTSYSGGQFVAVASDWTLYAQWSNIYRVTFRHSEDSLLLGSGDTGHMECYALWINGVEQADLGAFSNGPRVYNLPYGTPIGVVVQTKYGSGRSYVTWNGTKVAGNSGDARYQFNLTSHLDIHFECNYFISNFTPQSYWNCYITTQ